MPRLVGLMLVAALFVGRTTDAQDLRSRTSKGGTYQLQLEVLKSRFGDFSDGQYWSRELAKAGYSLRISALRSGQEGGIEEVDLNRVKVLKVVGLLEADGSLLFPRQKFKRTEVDRFVKWLKELEQFGLQGNPEGQPIWGLNQVQFETVVKALSKPMDGELSGKPFEDCLALFPEPEAHPYRWTDEAEAVRRRIDREWTFPEWQSIGGLSQGTIFSLLLSQHKLGFWPERKPDGTIDLVVEPLSTGQKLWPIGFDAGVSPGLIAPKFLRQTEIGILQDVPLLDLVQVISVQSETPIVFDTNLIDRVNIDLASAKATHPAGRKNWSLILSRVLFANQLTQKVVIDENGTAFAIVTPREALLKQMDETSK